MKPYYEVSHTKLFNKDCRNMSELPDESVDLLVTDPPYGIGFMGKDWDKFNEIVDPQRAYAKKKGFKKLPRNSSAYIVEFFTPIWKECLRVLKPGAFAFVMCIPRADCLSRVIISLEDAGFRVDFTPIYWAYASGFPKAQNIGKAVDKRLGALKVVGKRHNGMSPTAMKPDKGWHSNEMGRDLDILETNSPQAKALDGSYSGFQPKPAVEIILVCMKPLSEKTYVDQALKNRKGITWLDSCRIPYESEGDKSIALQKNQGNALINRDKLYGGYGDLDPNWQRSGRFPANLLVSDDVLNDGRERTSQRIEKPCNTPNLKTEWGGTIQTNRGARGYTDSGSFSRYFDLDKWWEERIKQLPESAQRTFPFLIVPKASKSEKNKGLETMPEVLKSGLPLRDGSGDYVLNEFGDGSMSTRNTRTKNYHPTVKPIKLMSYLITLGSREGDTVVDPFIGTGSTAIACQILGRKCTGYEINANYCEIAKNRLTYYCQKAMSPSCYSQHLDAF